MSANWSPAVTYLLKPNGIICPYRKEVKDVQGKSKLFGISIRIVLIVKTVRKCSVHGNWPPTKMIPLQLEPFNIEQKAIAGGSASI